MIYKNEETQKFGHIQKEPYIEILRSQLSELNTRARWYSSQLWHVPFAYLGVTGVVLGNLGEKSSYQLSLGLLCAGIFGILVSIHLFGIMDGEKRAVNNLQKVERELRLESTVKYKPFYVIPLVLSVMGATIFYFIAFIWIIIQKILDITTY